MADRSAIKLQLRGMLGLPSDDPLASDAQLNPIIQQAYQGLVAECADVAPDAFKGTGTVAIANQTGTTPSDVYQVRAVRDTDDEGMDLMAVPDDELPLALDPSYSLVGASAPFTLNTSSGFPTGSLWVSYTKTAETLADDTSVPALLPTSFHDVIAFEALFAMALGGEQRIPPDLKQRGLDRKGLLMTHLVRRSGGVASRTRLVAGDGPYP